MHFYHSGPLHRPCRWDDRSAERRNATVNLPAPASFGSFTLPQAKTNNKKNSRPRSPRCFTGGWVVIQRCEPISATAACCLLPLLGTPPDYQTQWVCRPRVAPRPSAPLLAIFWDWRCWKTKTLPAERIPIGRSARREWIKKKVEVLLGRRWHYFLQ